MYWQRFFREDLLLAFVFVHVPKMNYCQNLLNVRSSVRRPKFCLGSELQHEIFFVIFHVIHSKKLLKDGWHHISNIISFRIKIMYFIRIKYIVWNCKCYHNLGFGVSLSLLKWHRIKMWIVIKNSPSNFVMYTKWWRKRMLYYFSSNVAEPHEYEHITLISLSRRIEAVLNNMLSSKSEEVVRHHYFPWRAHLSTAFCQCLRFRTLLENTFAVETLHLSLSLATGDYGSEDL